MRSLFRAAGVDYVQWRALARAYMWMDFATLLGVYGRKEARRAAVRLLASWGFLTALGVSQASVVWLARDAFLAAALVTTMVMLWVGLTVLTQSTTLVMPEDYAIVGFRPVSSRTYFAVRLTAFLWHTFETTLLVGWLPVVAFLTREDGTPLLALAGAAALAGSSLAVAMAVVVLYGSLIRIVTPARLAMLLSYAGAAATIALSVGFMLATNHFAGSETPGAFLHATLARDLRTMWFPGAWFAAYVALAQGARGPAEIAAATLSVMTLVALALSLRGRLSSDYAERMAELTTLSMGGSGARERGWSFLRGEGRAVALLVRSHLRGDTRFQLAVAMNVIMGVAITAMSSGFRMPADPFGAGDWDRMRSLTLPMFALLFVPAQVYQTLVQTPSHQASWLFFSSPADRVKLVTAGRDAIAAFVLLPALLMLTVFFAFAYGHAGHAVLHTAFLGGIAYASLQLSVLITPRLPFSAPFVQGSAHGFPIFANLLVLLIGMPFFALLQFLAYRSAFHLAVGFAGVAALVCALNVLTRRRIERRASTLVYIH